MRDEQALLSRIRWTLGVFIALLVLSGLTAFPIEWEMDLLGGWLGIDPSTSPGAYGGPKGWIALVAEGVRETNAAYPFLAYGTDWLAFGHLVIAAFFVGPWLEPVRNRFVVTVGLVACAGVIPLALIAGPIREIPFWWQLVDCSFGVIGAIPLLLVRRDILALERLHTPAPVLA
jgi:hypothetical protein